MRQNNTENGDVLGNSACYKVKLTDYNHMLGLIIQKPEVHGEN